MLVAGTAAAYVVAAKFGLSLAVVAPQVTAVWPPTGIALAALLLIGPGVWPGVALGAFVANVTVSESIGTAVGIATGNTLEAILGAWALRRLGLHTALDRLRDVLALVVIGAIGSTMVSATIGAASLCAGGIQPWALFGSLWSVWWIGDAMGDLVVAPLLLVWSSVISTGLDLRRLLETVALLVVTLLASSIVVLVSPAIGSHEYPLHYMVFPLVVWAALRLRQPGTTALTLLVSAIAIWSSAHRLGPAALVTANESLILVQLFMAVVATTGLFLGAAIAERDTSEARRMIDFNALEASEKRLRLALDAGRMGVWDWNIGKAEIEWSENIEPIYGLPPGTFKGTMKGSEFPAHPDDRARVDEAVQRAIAGGTDYDVEFRNVWPDGSIHWLRAKGSVMRSAGRPVRMLGIAMDVTNRRHLEEELRERIGELADADRRKDEFLAMLGHELRNPLAAISTSLQLLHLDASGRERFLAIADRQLDHLVRLVDDLLDVSRISRGKITLRKEPVLLANLVKQAIDLTRPLIQTQGLSLTASLPSEPVQLNADAVRIAQVLLNLLENAAKFTPRGGSIWLTAECAANEVAVRVRDTGVGLSAELLPRVFDIFVQGDATPERTWGGLGIGLTLVRALVELHGGRVEARSAGVGQGSEFVVYLPVFSMGLPVREATIANLRDEPLSRPLHVMIVEDNRDVADSLAAVLELRGHKVKMALDGFGALRAAESFAPEVILSDLGLPGMDGYELARQLRRQARFARVVLVAISGYGGDEHKRRAFEAGFDHHIVKPVDIDRLVELVDRISSSHG